MSLFLYIAKEVGQLAFGIMAVCALVAALSLLIDTVIR